MLKYDYKKIIAEMQENHINIKDLLEHEEYKSANQPNYSGEKLFDFMAKKGITTKEIERKMQLGENTVWKIITGKEVFTKSIAKGIAKLYNLSDDFFHGRWRKKQMLFSR